MVERLELIKTVISEIKDEEYIAEYFECEDINYEIYFVGHKHSFNIDPEHPNIPIKPYRMRKIKQQGCVYDKQGCEWRQYLHVHFPKNLWKVSLRGEMTFPYSLNNYMFSCRRPEPIISSSQRSSDLNR